MKTNSKLKRFCNWIWRQKWWILGIIIIIVILIVIPSCKKTPRESDFATLEVSRGELQQIVSATGEIEPLNTVNVGSQISGTIDKLYVDYNSKVKKGDILLTIEPSVLQAAVDEAEAALVSAKSQYNYAKNEYNRDKMLYEDGFISRAEMEQSETNYEQSEQTVHRMQSQYERAKTNLGYATITSPVDGTVISREVDVGQTVAASFQTPNLFKIAEDLSKMQIETSVSEADIGVVKEKQIVDFTVDAYPSETFQGTVRQIRLSPTTESNVVVYTVVIDVDNADLRLMPGMTAFVTIVVSEKSNVLKVKNAALLLKTFDGILENAGDKNPKTDLAVLRDNKIIFIPYKKGLITATETELISNELREGDKIIIGKFGQHRANNLKHKDK